jgi:hypothetical protein
MAAFYVISGQLDRYRAVDPDSPLLMAAHQATTRAERQALHSAAGATDHDIALGGG